MDDQNWTIEPKQRLLNLKLHEIWAYRYLLYQLIHRDVVAFYKQTILGPLWFFIQPALTTTVFFLIFGKLAKVSTDGLPQPLFYLSGIIAWNYFAECLNKTSTVFKDNANIFGKVYFPRIIVPLSITISVLVRFGIQMLLFISFMIYYHYQGFRPPITGIVFLFPAIVILIAALGLGMGTIIAALTARYRDLAFLVAFGLQLMMYTTTVIYPLSAAPADLKWLIQANPITAAIETFRYIFLGKSNFSFPLLIYSAITTSVILFIGLVAFNKTQQSFIDTI